MLRELGKSLALLPFRGWALYYLARVALLRPFFDRDRALELVSESLARRTGVTGFMLRRAFFRMALPCCGPDCTFAAGVIVTKADVVFGRNVALGLNTIVSAAEFGNDIVVGPGVLFLSGRQQHGYARLDIPMVDQPGVYRTIRIGDDVWIGAGAIIMDDVGHGCIVAAGSVVIDPLPAYSIVAGSPARVVSQRTHRPDESIPPDLPGVAAV